jgi:probable DNA metabolism protein
MSDRRAVAARFDGTFDGLLTVVYRVYYQGLRPDTLEETYGQQALNTDSVWVQTEPDQAARVWRGIRQKISQQAAGTAYHAFLAEAEGRYTWVFRYLVHGFQIGKTIDSHEEMDYVLRTHDLARRVGNEAHLAKGFLRFAQTEAGPLYAKVTPVHNILPLLAEHFAARLQGQPWLIHDTGRGLAAVYDGAAFVVAEVPREALTRFTQEELNIRALWKTFHKTVAIPERTNLRLQHAQMTRKFRKNALEME